MTRTRGERRRIFHGGGLVLAGIVLLGLTGCDYWPPALQTQIEQLKADLQTLTAERARLDQQVVMLTQSREELQGHVDQLTRVNKERASTIAELERTLKVARTQKSGAVSKSAGKVAPKAVTKAKPTSKSKKPSRAPAKKKPATSGTYYKSIR